MEMSSRRKVSPYRKVMQTRDTSGRDPRFDPTLGEAPRATAFRSRYGFLIDDVLQKDIKAAEKVVKKARREDIRANAKLRLSRLRQQQHEAEARLAEEEAARSVRAKQRQTAAAGGRVFFPKRRELKQLAEEKRFELLRQRGGNRAVERVIRKKRERNARRDRKKLGEMTQHRLHGSDDWAVRRGGGGGGGGGGKRSKAMVDDDE